MRDTYKEGINIGITLAIVALSLFIIHPFIPSLIWAGIIAIATYPLYFRWEQFFGTAKNTSALLFTVLLSLVLLLPLSWLLTILVKELQLFINYMHVINRQGGPVPSFIQDIPIFGADLKTYWDNHIGQPGKVKYILSNLHVSLAPASYYLKQIGVSVAHRSFQLGFTLLTLFFFYRDADNLLEELNRVGEYCLGKRWFMLANKLPKALRGTVNGTILVGLGVGVLLGICYALVGFPAPTLVGFVTACAAMIPFAAPIVFLVVALILVASAKMLAAFIVLLWGGIVLFIADHFIKPLLIGGAIKLPFLAVLFGILGGVETLGLLGLFVGPMVMVLFVTLWRETSSYPCQNSLIF
jgi:predicted PurR-regulated permease PerM